MIIKYGLDYEYMCNQLSDLEDMWNELFNYLINYSLALSPADYEIQEIMKTMNRMEEKFNEKRK